MLVHNYYTHVIQKLFTESSMYVAGKPCKELGVETYYWVMIYAPMTFLTLNRLQNYDGWTRNKHSNKHK